MLSLFKMIWTAFSQTVHIFNIMYTFFLFFFFNQFLYLFVCHCKLYYNCTLRDRVSLLFLSVRDERETLLTIVPFDLLMRMREERQRVPCVGLCREKRWFAIKFLVIFREFL